MNGILISILYDMIYQNKNKMKEKIIATFSPVWILSWTCDLKLLIITTCIFQNKNFYYLQIEFGSKTFFTIFAVMWQFPQMNQRVSPECVWTWKCWLAHITLILNCLPRMQWHVVYQALFVCKIRFAYVAFEGPSLFDWQM